MTAPLETLGAASGPTIIEVWAPWCGHCRAQHPRVQQASRQHPQVNHIRLNADEQPALASTLKVYGLPTLIALKDGQEVARLAGEASTERIHALFEAALTAQAGALPAISSGDRLLRLGAAAVLVGFAFTIPNTWWLGVVAALVAFSAVADRCPALKVIRQALKR